MSCDSTTRKATISSSAKLAIRCQLLGSINLRCGFLGSINPTINDEIVSNLLSEVGNFTFLECHSSMQRCADSVLPIHFLWDGLFSDTISRRGPMYEMSSASRLLDVNENVL